MSVLMFAMLIMTPSIDNKEFARQPSRTTKSSGNAPALAGVTPPPQTTLANMDITVKPRSRGEPAVYEFRSPQTAATFASQYAANAKRAGYRVLIKGQVVVGVKNDGTSIRLRVIEADCGSKAILTVKQPANDRT